MKRSETKVFCTCKSIQKWFLLVDHKCQLSDPNDRRLCGPPNVARQACEDQHNCCFDDSMIGLVDCYKGNL